MTAPSAEAASRTVTLKTSDRAPGGTATLKVEWWGYSDGQWNWRVTGTVKDVEADGWCAQVRVKSDDYVHHVDPIACPKGTRKNIRIQGTAARATVQVCLTKDGSAVDYCSRWA
ncbi:hypothetical protein [Streptomyces sp. NPDC001744]|uniref:hypothetical protein n=1 Tax=Streptomyces sp. NPDC001744 TaxID=3364606 RepID=UPI0036CE15F5